MNFKIFTLFPKMFPGPLGHSIAATAMEKDLWSYTAIDIRNYATDQHQQVDDTPCGGGAGMVMRADILSQAINANIAKNERLIYMSPRGKPLSQQLVTSLSKEQNISIICGRFEGIDQRVIDHYNMEEVSLGDYILSGGEIAALALMDSCIRLIPGVLGNKSTLNEESFTQNADYTGLLEYPLYTRPSKWNNLSVPDVLLSGNHDLIKKWRLKKSKEITKKTRPDLWREYLDKDD